MSIYITVMLLLLNYQDVASVIHSGTIKEDTKFFYKQLTTIPSLITQVEFSIVCSYNGLRFNIYTTEDNINLQTNCSLDHNGQVLNQNLGAPVRPGTYKNYTCLEQENGLLHFTGTTIIQDFKPRIIGFSIGYNCYDPDPTSLKGLSFNISVSGQRNKTNCIPLPNRPQLNCVKFYPFASFPNLFGHKQEEARPGAEALKMDTTLLPGGCYKFVLEIVCYMFIPRCDVTRKVTIPLCKETCWDFLNGCKAVFQMFIEDYDVKKFLNCNYLPEAESDIECFNRAVTCDAPPNIPNGKIFGLTNGTYPALRQLEIVCINETFVMKGNSTITCQYTGTWSQPPQCALRACPAPPAVEHAQIEEHRNVSEVYPWHTKVTYVCDNETYHMEGNSTITCLKNEHWSHVPDCVEVVQITNNQRNLKILEIVLPAVFVVLLALTSSCLVVLYKRKLKLKRISFPDTFTLDNTTLTRMKKYDAFVCYHFDTDDTFIKNTIIPELEQNHDPPFKLFIHEIDFTPGSTILENMQVAVQNSNSAILVLSQGFVDSVWCQQEFQYCYIEHMNDPAFKLFVIMMQPMESLQNLNECMKQYFVQETYLKKNDKNLFTKIAAYLTMVKKPKDDENTQRDTEVNLGEEHDQGHLEIEGGIPTDNTQNDPDTNDTDNTVDDRRTVDADVVIHYHENITNVNNDLDVNIVIDDVDDVDNEDENVPLLLE